MYKFWTLLYFESLLVYVDRYTLILDSAPGVSPNLDWRQIYAISGLKVLGSLLIWTGRFGTVPVRTYIPVCKFETPFSLVPLGGRKMQINDVLLRVCLVFLVDGFTFVDRTVGPTM